MESIKQVSKWLALAVLLAGCASSVHVETDEAVSLARYKTYQWVETKSSQTDSRNVTAFGERAIHAAAQQELAKKGWREVSQNPDVLITHDILVRRTTQQQSDPLYTQPFSRVYYNPYFRRWGTVFYPSQFVGFDTYRVPVREGTLTITMMDANTDKPVWQAWSTQTMDTGRFTNKDVEKAVQNILKKLKV